MIMLLAAVFFTLGLIIGSFLNVVIYRLNTARSLGGRSACMSCGHQLSWYELIPVLSFLVLRGRCKNCKTKISIQYPLVELLTGAIFASLFVKFQVIFFMSTFAFSITYIYYVFMFSLLLVIASYDFKHKIIPDSLSFLFGVLSFAGLFFWSSHNFFGFPVFFFHVPSTWDFLSGIFISLPFALLWLVSKGAWMGLGDAKLALGLGWFLGTSVALSGLALAFWSGAIIGMGMIFFSRNFGMKSEIPFASYMAIGAFLAFVFQLNLFAISL